MSTNKQPYRADGGDLSTDRLKEIADNPYGDEEKWWLAKRVLALANEVYDLKHPGTYLPSKRETPALDAFLAEVRAQGVEMFAAHKRERQQALRSRNMRMSEEAAGMAADAEEFAAQLRKGVQS